MVLTVPTVTDVVAAGVGVVVVVVVVVVDVEVLASVLLVLRLPPVVAGGVDVEIAEDVSELEACLFLRLHGYLLVSKYST